MQKAFAALFSLWLVVLAGSCARAPAHDRAQEVFRLLDRVAQAPSGVRGVGSFRLVREGVAVSGRMAFAAKPPESFRVELLSPFGQPVVSMASDGKKLYLYDRPERDFTEAPPKSLVLKKATAILVSPGELASILCGHAPVVSASVAALSEDPEGDGQILTLSDAWGGTREKLWLNPDLSVAFRAEVFSNFGKKEYSVWLTKRKNAPDSVLLQGPDNASLMITPDRLLTDQEIPPETFVLEKPKTP